MMSNSPLANGGATLFFTTLLIHAGIRKEQIRRVGQKRP
jgi:hypothetical protein